MTPLFDSHAHYFDARFASEECPEGVDALLGRIFREEGISHILNVGTDIPSSLLAVEQAKKYPGMYVAAGIHPSDSRHYPDMDAELAKLKALLTQKDTKIVALGEIGLDYHYPDTDEKQQAAYLDSQLSLARKLDLPVVIHDREAHGDCFDAVCRYPDARGVFHSYSGSEEMARDLIRRGWYISFSGTITFKNARKIAAVAKNMPHERVLIETDCPYLAPHPFRGQMNHSGLLHHTAAMLAELWELPLDEVARITSENAKHLFFKGEER